MLYSEKLPGFAAAHPRETMTVDAGTVTFTGDGETHFLRNDGDTPLEFLALVLNLPAQA